MRGRKVVALAGKPDAEERINDASYYELIVANFCGEEATSTL